MAEKVQARDGGPEVLGSLWGELKEVLHQQVNCTAADNQPDEQ